MKGFHLKRNLVNGGKMVRLYSGNYRWILGWCYAPFVKKYPHLKLRPGERIPVNIKITKRNVKPKT